MPWKDAKTVEQTREEFVRQAMTHSMTFAALCRSYGISRPTGYKWLQRYQEGQTLSDQSRRPFHTPNRIAPEMEEKIITFRQCHPAIGAVKIRRMLKDEGVQDLPCSRTVNAVLKRNDLITKEASKAATPYIRFQKELPNDMWQADFKGDFLLENGQRCYPLSVIDDCTRFCLNADAKENMQLNGTMESFTNTFRTFGMPKILLCDNGVPWGSSQSTSITRFETWLMELGILPIHIRARHPQTQGKVERFNRSYKQEQLQFYTPKDMIDAQRTRIEYQNFYNNQRPHFALKLDTPAAHYIPSQRPFLEKIPVWDYEAGGERRMVKSSGYVTYDSQGYYLSEGLGGKEVFLYRTAKENEVKIVFRQFVVARLNLESRTITNRKIYLLHDDPRSQNV